MPLPNRSFILEKQSGFSISNRLCNAAFPICQRRTTRAHRFNRRNAKVLLSEEKERFCLQISTLHSLDGKLAFELNRWPGNGAQFLSSSPPPMITSRLPRLAQAATARLIRL